MMLANTMSVSSVVGYCLIAFCVGYAAGSIQRIFRRAVEMCE